MGFQGTNLTELDKHQHRGPHCNSACVNLYSETELKSHGKYAPQTWYIYLPAWHYSELLISNLMKFYTYVNFNWLC